MSTRHGSLPALLPRERRYSRFDLGRVVHLFVLLVAVTGSWFVMDRFGIHSLANFLVAGIVGIVFAFVSFRSLLVPFFLWMFAVGGFRFLFAVQAPLLPDMTLERILLVWLAAVFMIQYSTRGTHIKRPFTLELLLLTHALYILVRLYMNDMAYFHVFSVSIIVPYAAFFFAKNIISSPRRVRALFFVLLLLEVYYYVTSIAEQYHINWLIWPRFILEKTWFLGRSSGPFKNAGVFGNVMGMILPIHLYFIITTKSKGARALLFLSFTLSLVGLFFSYTRGSWLAGMAGMAVVAYFGRRHYLRYVLPAAVIVPFILLAIISAGQTEFFKDRVSQEGNIEGRIGTGVTLLRVWRDNPFFGCGPFRYLEAKDAYVAPVTVPGVGTIHFQQFRHNAVHDMYWGPLAEDGLVGAILQAAIYFLILRRFLTKARRSREGNEFAMLMLPVLGGVLANYLIGGLTISYRHASMIGAMFYGAAGIIDGYDPDATADAEGTGTVSAKG